MANQAWQIESPNKLVLNDLGPIPKPGPKQVLLRVHAVSLNFRDILIAEHSPLYPVIAKPNLVPGSDGAGVVEAVGTESTWKKGDRVIVHPNSWQKGHDDIDFDVHKTIGGGEWDGTFRRWMVVDDDRIFRAPEEMSLEGASTLFTAGVTAYRALFHGGKKPLRAGMTVLTQGTGGVSCFAIQIAAAVGATVIATSSSDDKLEVAKKLGATHLINYRKNPDWASEALKLTGGKGVDIVIDVVGPESIEQSVKSLTYGGSVVIIGVLSADSSHKSNIAADILFGTKTVTGNLGAGSKETGEDFVRFLNKHRIQPAIAQTFVFEEADKSLEALKKLTAPGKIVVRC